MCFIPSAVPPRLELLARQEKGEEEVAKAAAKNVERRVVRLLVHNVNVLPQVIQRLCSS